MIVLLLACGGPSSSFTLELPEGFPEPVIPTDNPLTAEKIELGRHLFYEARLSGNSTQSCGTCHQQQLAFTDGRTVGEGSTGALHPRNVNGLSNVVYNSTLTWANPVLTELETQMLLPLFGDDPVEMAAEDSALTQLAQDPLYQDLYDQAYPDLIEKVTWDTTTGAIASFLRTMITGNSRFDQYAFQDDTSALSAQELKGMTLFYSEKLECQHCHGGFNFSEASRHANSVFDAKLFQNTGLYNLDGDGAYPANNTGVFSITGDPADMGRFRAPSLRNIAVTGPYAHDGSVETLEEMIRIYEAGGRTVHSGPYAGDGTTNPLKSGLVAGFELTDDERTDLIAFLGTLTDEDFLNDPAFTDPFAP